MITITLPWPSSALSPNGRDRWAKIEATKPTLEIAAYLTAQAGYFHFAKQPAGVRLEVVFHKPNRRRMDIDNLVGRMKSVQDGVFLALGWDDRIICEATYRMGQVIPGGQVVMTITGIVEEIMGRME